MSANGQATRSRLQKWSVPKQSSKAPAGEIDEAGQTLSRLARSLLDTAPHVLREVTSASQSAIRREAYLDLVGAEDRAWRVAYEGIEAFCVVDSQGECELLGLIVGAAPRSRLSEIERRIVGEAVSRLFAGSSSDARSVREELRVRPLPPTWCCTIELFGPHNRASRLLLFAACMPPPPPSIVRPNLHAVSLPLRATIPANSCDLASLSQWQSGSLLHLRRSCGGPYALLYAGRQRIARAQLGSLFGQRAVMLTELLVSGR